jgi:hypothetical protein
MRMAGPIDAVQHQYSSIPSTVQLLVASPQAVNSRRPKVRHLERDRTSRSCMPRVQPSACVWCDVSTTLRCGECRWVQFVMAFRPRSRTLKLDPITLTNWLNGLKISQGPRGALVVRCNLWTHQWRFYR